MKTGVFLIYFHLNCFITLLLIICTKMLAVMIKDIHSACQLLFYFILFFVLVTDLYIIYFIFLILISSDLYLATIPLHIHLPSLLIIFKHLPTLSIHSCSSSIFHDIMKLSGFHHLKKRRSDSHTLHQEAL